MPNHVRDTVEFRRVASLQTKEELDGSRLTSLLRTPDGEQTLRPVQAEALLSIGMLGGFFGAIGVGEGKTLISLLAPEVLDAQRPLLVAPAGLLEKTRRDRAAYAKHWRIPTSLRLLSYELLGRKQAAEELEAYAPDLIVCDEVHRLANPDAAVTRRFTRYLEAHPTTAFVGLSGTIMNRSLRDFAHILRWALKPAKAPVPASKSETEEWALALDLKVEEGLRFAPGALTQLAASEDVDSSPVVTARRGFQRRLFSTPGCVRHLRGEDVSCPIVVRGLRYETSLETQAHVSTLRKAMRTPDDWQLTCGAEVYLHVRQLALGFYSAWEPRPPQPWRDARRAWCAYVREVLQRSRHLDSPEQVFAACESGERSSEHFDAWVAIRDTFRPNVVFRWLDHSALAVAADWAKKPGVVWVEHVAFGRALSKMTGLPYFGSQGLAEDGAFIDDAEPKRAIIASVAANKEGRNLQHKWSRNLVTSPPASSKDWQQLIARTHRPGQEADEVLVDVLLGCSEHLNAWFAARAGAAVVEQTMGERQRILLADVVDWPSAGTGPLWEGPEKVFETGSDSDADEDI